MPNVTVKDLLDAGIHFGHRTRRWNPKMARFIFGERNGIYIIDLEKTMVCLEKACAFVRPIVERGQDVLFVGTKKQAQTAVQEAAARCGMPFVTQRWLGGMLTNFETVRKSINRLHTIQKMEEVGDYQFLTKKEVASLKKEKEKLQVSLAGIEAMRKLPGALFVVDSAKENIAVREGRKLGIPIVALIDTNCNPDEIDYPLPGNDDATRAITLICGVISDAVLQGRGEYERVRQQEEAKESAAVQEATQQEIDEAAIEARLAAEEQERLKKLKAK